MLIAYLACFGAGFLAKLTDWLDDKPKGKPRPAECIAALAYGFFAAFAASQSPALATLAVAIAAGMLFAGKIDSQAHQRGFAVFLLGLYAFRAPAIDLPLTAFFVLLALADEFLNDAAGKYKDALGFIARHRLVLDFGVLALALFTGEWVYLFACLALDAGYQLSCFAGEKGWFKCLR
ncbi:MAG: hypothetical protein WC607_02030 [Candidatus Micrarchaeia archaeon]